MTPTIEIIKEKKLIGKSLAMSFADYRISELWKSFLPRRREVTNSVSSELISLVVYPPTHFSDFRLTKQFVKWAAVEVAEFTNLPAGMETFILPRGLYAIFKYKGPGSDSSVYQFILNKWLPASGYDLDNRPHFEVLGEKYKNDDPESEEDIYIPLKLKAI